MVEAVRGGESMRAVAERFRVSPSTVVFWVQRSAGKRLDRCNWSDGKAGPSRPWNRTSPAMERRVLAMRRRLRESSVLGEYGAPAIHAALSQGGHTPVPSVASIGRILGRWGVLDRVRRVRRPPPPRGWYLPAVAEGEAELDCFDFIEDLKIADGPLLTLLTATSLHGGLVDAWALLRRTAKSTVDCLVERWRREGLPTYAQFDHDTVFQGAHQFPDAIGRVSRLCLALGVIPLFAPPREPGFQNAIEGFNGLWQAKLWQRVHCRSERDLQQHSDRYIAAHRARNAQRREQAPERQSFPLCFTFDPNVPLRGTIIYLRRTDAAGRAQLLGRTFEVSAQWLHRLVRCEVDLTRQHIQFYALRRRAPGEQPLLTTIPYHRTQRPFHSDS